MRARSQSPCFELALRDIEQFSFHRMAGEVVRSRLIRNFCAEIATTIPTQVASVHYTASLPRTDHTTITTHLASDWPAMERTPTSRIARCLVDSSRVQPCGRASLLSFSARYGDLQANQIRSDQGKRARNSTQQDGPSRSAVSSRSQSAVGSPVRSRRTSCVGSTVQSRRTSRSSSARSVSASNTSSIPTAADDDSVFGRTKSERPSYRELRINSLQQQLDELYRYAKGEDTDGKIEWKIDEGLKNQEGDEATRAKWRRAREKHEKQIRVERANDLREAHDRHLKSIVEKRRQENKRQGESMKKQKKVWTLVSCLFSAMFPGYSQFTRLDPRA